MVKSLTERIADRISQKKPTKSEQNRAAFLANRSEIKQALNDGWSVKTIWETLYEEKKINYGYQGFLNHVNKLLIDSNSKSNNELVLRQKEKNQTSNKNVEIPGFSFNPVPNKEDLF